MHMCVCALCSEWVPTQASTGMTTGSWFVSFGAGLDDALEAVEDDLREAYVIPATVKASGLGWAMQGAERGWVSEI